MTTVGAGAVLASWERAQRTDGHDRAIALLDPTVDAASLPLGQRDALLLNLYREVRGPVVDALATCPACEAMLEVHLLISDLVAQYPPGYGRSEFTAVDLGSVVVRARCPTTADLIGVAGAHTTAAARTALLDRCVESVTRADGRGDPLNEDEITCLGTYFEQVDPLVDARIDIACAECGDAWSALLDVPALVWAQVSGVGRRLLREVDALARRYSWSETEILGMSDHRRHAYLDLT